jgi:type IV pilus assembly protein PilB
MDATTAFDARKSSLGDILVTMGVITPPQLQDALKECDPAQKNLGQILIAMGVTTEEKILKAVSIRLGISYFTTFEGMLEPDVVPLVPEGMARKHLVVPLLKTEDALTVGMANPVDIVAIDELTRRTGLKILPVMTPLGNLMRTIQQVYGGKPMAEETVADPKAAVHAAKDQFVRFQAAETSVIETVDTVLHEAIMRKVTDIHIESAEKLARVRYRIDGMLQDARTVDKETVSAVIARVKILAQLDITETRLPQDGHIRIDHKGLPVDLRVSTVPSVYGEKVVLRILDSSKSLRKLSDLNLSPINLKSLQDAIQVPNQITLVTGPTGSGKTTTLYAGLAELNDPSCNIVTLEDPVEYRIDRITQIETHAKIGLTFAAGLRAILRQDPNVILVGEIRDLETAEIAIQAAITGHRVFSTLHTNDAPSAIHRLITMRVEPYLIAAALGGVMAQRLVRRLCEACKKEHPMTEAEETALGSSVKNRGPFFESTGCQACFQTGYSGRLAIHEWLKVTRSIKELTLKRASIDELRAAARAEGMKSLQEDALERASQGLTSLTEVLRVTQHEAD